MHRTAQPLGGALARPPTVGNAVGHREARYLLHVLSALGSGDPSAAIAVARSIHHNVDDALAPRTVGRSLGFLFGDTTTEQVRAGYDSGDFRRLAELKATYDPTNMFRFNHNIAPLPRHANG